MYGYILDLREKYGHLTPKKPQYLPQNHQPIDYVANQQIVQPTNTSPYLDDKGIKRVQGIVGALLYHTVVYVERAVNNKLLVALGLIGYQKAATTK